MSAEPRFYPSSAGTWMHCPGSVHLRDRVKQEPNEAMLLGLEAHKYAAMLLRNQDPRTEAPYSDEALDMAQKCVKVLTEELTDPKDCTYEVEQTIRLNMPGDRERNCTPDVVVRNRVAGSISIVDFKTGYRPVEAYQNPQLACYHRALDSGQTGPPSVSLVIIQPNSLDGVPVKQWDPDEAAVDRIMGDLREAIEDARSPTPSVVPGTYCRYCNAAGICPALKKQAEVAALIDPCGISAKLSPEELAERMVGIAQTRKLLDASYSTLSALLIEEMEEGDQVGRIKCEKSLGSVAWKPEITNERLSVMARMFGVPPEEVCKPPGRITPKQFRDKGVDMKAIDPLTDTQPGKLQLKIT